MIRYKKYSIIFLITVILIILSACTTSQNLANTASSEGTVISMPKETSAAFTENKPYSYANSADIHPEILWYLFTFSYEDYLEYNEHFFDSIQVDLDGDGADETIELLPGEQNSDGAFTSIWISIDGKRIELEADPGWSIGFGDSIYGSIIDIDKDDEYKELVIYQQSGFDTRSGYLENASVIVYTDKEPKVIVKWDGIYVANGTGYVVDIKYTQKLAGDYALALLYIKKYSQNSGFKEIKLPVDGVLNYSSQIIGQQTILLTKWDQYVASRPESEPDIMIQKNTRIHFGLYHEAGWIEVYAADGSMLGWLDLKSVDIDRYIDYAIKATCH